MKLRYLFASLVAAVSVTLFTSCNDEFEPTYLDNTTVNSSYVAIPLGGGSTTIQVTTADSYTIEVPEKANWLTVTPTTGAAGTNTITFSAESTVDGRNCEVLLKSGEDTQHINVIQGLSTVSTATCAEVLNGIENKTYQVKGTCTAIANTTYGNFYMNDGTGELYVYGTVDNSGSYNWSSFNIEVGDEVTVQGPKVTYSGTVELKDATFISVTKSLIKVDSVSVANLTSDGGDTEVFLVNKGSNLYVDIPEDAQSWLSMKQIAGNKVVFHAAANTAGPRETTVTFKTVSGGKNYTAQTTIAQDGLSGTIELPYTVAEACAFCQSLSSATTYNVAVKGKVSRVLYDFSASYGTATFWISDDGTSSVAENGKSTTDKAHDFECYSVYYFDNKAWAEGNAPISVGDEVLVYGQVTNYNGTAETNSKAAYVYSINGVTTDANGVGSEKAPFNTLGAIAAANAGTTNNVYVNGKISKVYSAFSADYGNGTFYISQDGTYYGDKTKDFEVYRALWFNNQKWVDGNTQVAVGDDVTVYGLLTVYNGTAETSSGKAYVTKLNGKTAE